MEIQWGDNPEYTIHLFTDLSYWALPLCVYWWGSNDSGTGIHFSISIKVLCLGLTFEIWRYKR